MIIASQYYRVPITPPPPSPYTAWWKLETDGLDYSGNGNDLIMNGSVPFGINGGFASAGGFTGSDFFNLPISLISAFQASSNWSIEYDAYCVDYGTYRTVIDFHPNDFIGTEAGSGALLWNDGNGGGGFFYGGTALPLGEWHTIKWAWDGVTRTCYTDGVLTGSSPSNGAIVGDLIASIGLHSNGGLNFTGYLKNFKAIVG